MAGTPKQKKALAKRMADYFSKRGYLGIPRDFNKDDTRPERVTLYTIGKIFGSWARMLGFLNSFIDTMESMKGIPETKPVVKPAKPAKKAEKEGVHGKDI